MNWLQYILKAVSVIPVILAGVEHIVTDAKSGATKKQLAMESLAVATGTAGVVVPPEHQQAAAAASEFASTLIDQTVKLYNVIGWPEKPQTVAATAAQ